MQKQIHVAVAVIKIKDRVLIARRPDHLHKGGFWEFPGGKVEPQEKVENALIRECIEELNIQPVKFKPLQVIEHQYPEKNVILDVWSVDDYLGVPKGLEGQPLVWCETKQLTEFQFPEANQEIIQLISNQ